MVKPIIIAMMLVSTPLFASETLLLSKVTQITGCEAWTRSPPLPDRVPVLTQLKNLASRITLLAKIVSPQQFNFLTGSTTEELDTSLARIAENLLETSANAIKAEDLKEQLDLIEGRILNNLSDDQRKVVTIADVKSSVTPIEVTEAGNSTEFDKPKGAKAMVPSQAKP